MQVQLELGWLVLLGRLGAEGSPVGAQGEQFSWRGGPSGAGRLSSSPVQPHTGVDIASTLQRPRWKFVVKGKTPHLGLWEPGGEHSAFH